MGERSEGETGLCKGVEGDGALQGGWRVTGRSDTGQSLTR